MQTVVTSRSEDVQSNVVGSLIPLSQVHEGEVCYTPRYGFKVKVVRQSEFETEITVLTEVKPGSRKNFVRSNTELVALTPIDLEDVIERERVNTDNPVIVESDEEEEIIVATPIPSVVVNSTPTQKRRGRPKKETKATPQPIIEPVQEKAPESHQRPVELSKRGALIDLVVNFLATGPKTINDITKHMLANDTHPTKQECAAFFRSTFASEEKRAMLKGEQPRMIRKGDNYLLAK